MRLDLGQSYVDNVGDDLYEEGALGQGQAEDQVPDMHDRCARGYATILPQPRATVPSAAGFGAVPTRFRARWSAVDFYYQTI